MVVRALTGGDLLSMAKAVTSHQGLWDLVFYEFVKLIDQECTNICKRSLPSLFRKMSTSEVQGFQWKQLVKEIQTVAPSLYKMLSTICSHSDHRNKHKHCSTHWPSICMAAAILLKERSREMCGLQGVFSLLLFASRVDKVVCYMHPQIL